MQLKPITNRMLITSNIIVVIAILLSLLASVVSPDKFLLPIFFTFGFPLIVILNILFILLWIILRKIYFLISFVIILFSFQQISTIYPIHIGKKKVETLSKSLVIVSYNTMMNGSIKKYLPNHQNGVIDYLLKSNADIICIQEYYVTDNPEQLTQSDIDSLFKNYPYRYVKFDVKNYDGKTGLATFSKYPIVRNVRIKYESIFNASIYSDIVVNKDTIRVFNNHLESNRFSGNDLLMAKQLQHDFNSSELINTTMYFSQKLSIAYKVRANQADSVSKIIKSTPYKLIVCGDFNDLPNSYSYTTIKGNLNDAFVNCGTGFGWTFNSSIYKFRLDYIFYDNNFKIENFQIGKTYTSDHLPIKCILRIK